MAAAGVAGEPTLPDANASTLLLTNLASAPFPHPQRAEGYRYKDKLYPAGRHYSDNTVGILIPKGLRPGTNVDFVVHFHGWFNNVTNALAQFRLADQLAASRRDAILVVPQGPRDAPDSFGGKLEEPGGLERFMGDVLAAIRGRPGLGEARLGNLVLSGHSGGYRVIAFALAQGGLGGHVREVWLFDALYGQADKYRDWLVKPERRLLAIYTDGGGTLEETRNFMRALRSAGIAFLETEDAHATGPALRGNRLGFLHTDLGHNEVLAARRTFQTFLEASPSLKGPPGAER